VPGIAGLTKRDRSNCIGDGGKSEEDVAMKELKVKAILQNKTA